MKHASNPAGQTVYISGPITNNPNFVQQFDEAKDLLLKLGYARVLTPTLFPPGWSYEEYMEHCMLMVRHANVVVMLQNWANSPGATAERAYARSLKREVLELTTHPVYGLWLEGVSQGARPLHKELTDVIRIVQQFDDAAQYKEDYIDEWVALLQRSTALNCETYMQHMKQDRPKLHALVAQRLEATLRAKEDAEIAGMQEAKAEALQRAKNGIAKLYADYVDACREMISLYPDHHVEIPAPRVLPGPVAKPAEVFQAAEVSRAAGGVMADEILNMPWLVQPEAAGLLAHEIDAFDELGELCNQFAEAVSAWMQTVPSLKDASHIKLLRWIAARLSPKQQHRYLSDPFETPEYLAKPPSVLLVLRTEPCGIGYRLVFNAEQIKTGWIRGLGHVMALYWLREPTPDEEAEVAPLRARIVMYPSGKAVLKYVSTGAESCDLHIVDGDKSIAEYLKKQSGTFAQETEAAVERAVSGVAAVPVRGRQADALIVDDMGFKPDEFWNREPSALQPEKFRQKGNIETITERIRMARLRELRDHFKRTTGLEPTHAIRRFDNTLASNEEYEGYKELAPELQWVDQRHVLFTNAPVPQVHGACMSCFYLAQRQANGAWIVAKPKSDARKEWAEICAAHDVPPAVPAQIAQSTDPEAPLLRVLRSPPQLNDFALLYSATEVKAGALRELTHVTALHWFRAPTPEEVSETVFLRPSIVTYPEGFCTNADGQIIPVHTPRHGLAE